uniref:AB hydrolase-1 domain-containing protein n=1 Tax=Solanum lycopersicum TaxID=4081 RepID=A0A3Q7JYR5_SOLLC
MSAIVEPISPSKALIMDTMMDENNQQENMKMQDDESLMEEQFLGSSDHSTSDEVEAENELEPEVQEPKLYIICPERPELVLCEPFFSTPKECLFTLKEASRYKLKFSFTVSNNVVCGLKYINTTWKTGVRVRGTGRAIPSDTSIVATVALRSDHWRKNLPVLAQSHRVFSIDLIGYGYSDKPNPRELGVENFYSFETWGSQLNDFCKDVIGDKAFFICNSIGGLVGLQAAILEPQLCRGILLLNISLRMLHITKQPWFGRPLIKAFQNLLRNTELGKFFFKSVATPKAVKNILCQCYYDTSQVTDELVQAILLPGLEPGAVDVFLEFICYSAGPLPEELLPQVKCPVLVAWGDKDPWEPIELGRAYGNFDTVEDFVVLPNVGHCPQDEAPHLVNPLVESFVARHANV